MTATKKKRRRCSTRSSGELPPAYDGAVVSRSTPDLLANLEQPHVLAGGDPLPGLEPVRLGQKTMDHQVAAAILVGGGRGERSGTLKQFHMLAGRPMFLWAVEALLDGGCKPVVLVLSEETIDKARTMIGRLYDVLFTAG